MSIAVFLFTSCSSPVHIERDNSVNFSNYKTYKWLDNDGSTNKDHNRRNDLEERQIRNAVNQELQSQGWREVRNNPDLFLSYDVLVENSSKPESDPVYTQSYFRTFFNPYTSRWVNVYYPSQFLGYNRYEIPTKERTITISMIDARSDKTVWQGWTTGEVNSRHLSSKEIKRTVNSIFKKFDVAKS
jgi:hypothetical protein